MRLVRGPDLADHLADAQPRGAADRRRADPNAMNSAVAWRAGAERDVAEDVEDLNSDASGYSGW
jgi:hypothetical protein